MEENVNVEETAAPAEEISETVNDDAAEAVSTDEAA